MSNPILNAPTRVFDYEALKVNQICDNPFVTVILLQALAQAGVTAVDARTGKSTITMSHAGYATQRAAKALWDNLKGIQIHYQTKINGESLAQLISSIK